MHIYIRTQAAGRPAYPPSPATQKELRMVSPDIYIYMCLQYVYIYIYIYV